MPPSLHHALRSTRAWAIRGIAAVLVLIVGVISVSQTLAQVIVIADPDRARLLAPGDGRLTASLATNRFLAQVGSGRLNQQPLNLARLALRQDPTAVSAVSTLGLVAQMRGDLPGARKMFAYSQILSRRDFPTQLWSIEYAVGRGDISGALTHYDVALRTSRTAPDLLFPVLASALADPAIRAATIKTFADRPSWGDAFISHLAKSNRDPRITSGFFAGLHKIGFPVFEEARVAVIDALIARGFVDASWSYYALVHPGADRTRSRDPRFSANPKVPSSFDWVPTSDARIIASFQRGDRYGLFDFTVPTGIGCVLLRQMQMLPPGKYGLIGHSAGIDQSAESYPYWSLTCQNGHVLGNVGMPNSADANGLFAGGFVVPVDCPVQTLSLVAKPSDAVAGVVGRIDQVQLVPVRP